MVEHLDIAVERPAEVTDATRFTLLEQVVQDAIVDETFVEGLNALAPTEVMQQGVIQIVGLQLLQGVVIHLDRGIVNLLWGQALPRQTLIGQLGSDEIALTRMTLQGDTRRFLRPSLQIDRGRVEVVHAMRQCIIH